MEVTVAEKEGMIRDGQDLITVVPLDATKAMLGDRIEVETIDGPEEIEIEPGTQPGAEKVVKGKGLPRVGGSRRRGVHRFVFNVVVPVNLSDEQLKLAGELDETVGEANRQQEESGLFSRMRRAWS